MKQPDLTQLMKSYKYDRIMEKQYMHEANRKEKCILCLQTKLRKDCVGCEFAV